MKNIIFLSHPLCEKTPGYGGNAGFIRKQTSSISNGDSCFSEAWELSNHIGTHIDAPRHFSSNGQTVTDFPAEFFNCTRVTLIDRPSASGDIIDVEDWCEKIPNDAELLLLRTGFESHRNTDLYWEKNPGLSPELGLWLRKNRPNLRMMGFDFISVTSYTDRPLGRVAHKAFLGPEHENSSPLLVIEDMSLKLLTTPPCSVVIAPLRVENTDGAPVTAIAFF